METQHPPISESAQTSITTNRTGDRPPHKPSGHQRLGTKIAIAAGVLSVVFLMLSNPSRSSYVDYAVTRLAKTWAEKCDGLEGSRVHLFGVGVPLNPVCQGLVSGSRPIMRTIISQTTEPRQNYGLFSVYDTDLPLLGRFRTVGIANQFITIEINDEEPAQ